MNPKSTVKINSSFLIIATQSSIIDWLVLLYKYSPSFLWQVKSQKDDKDFWYELSYFQVLTYGLGLTFINFETCPINIRRKKFFMKDYFNNKNTTRPYVIFPEATKTNRSGVLKIASSAMKEVYELGKIVSKPNIAFKIEAFDYSYKYFQPNNTTDSAGLCMLFKTCCQFSNRLLVYSQDSSSLIFDKGNDEKEKLISTKADEYDKLIQSYLATPDNKFYLSIDSKKHVEFLEFYKNNGAKKVEKEEKSK